MTQAEYQVEQGINATVSLINFLYALRIKECYRILRFEVNDFNVRMKLLGLNNG